MKPSLKLLIVFSLAIFINSCKQECTKESETLYVNDSYLPYIIPYSDTSTRLFLKNGTDTLLFRSQGLVEDFGYSSRFNGDCTVEQNLQRFSFQMKANDSNFFDITYQKIGDNSDIVYISFKDGYFKSYNTDFDGDYFKRYPIKSINVLNVYYDSTYSVSYKNLLEIYFNPKKGLIKAKNNNYTLELIK